MNIAVKQESRFIWRDGYRAKVKAEVAGEFLESFANKCGRQLRPRDVVEAAKSLDCPIHEAFEWDDSVAGAKYRLVQARGMLGALQITVERITDTSEPLRFFVNVRADVAPEKESRNERFSRANASSRQYMLLSDAITDPDKKEEVLADAYRDFRIFFNKYKHLLELADIYHVINKTIPPTKGF